MAFTLELADITIEVIQKDIKNIHLSVFPPTGAARIAAPSRMNRETIRLFAISKLGWIKREQQKLRTQDRESPREYLTRESHYVWGKRYLLKVIEQDTAPHVILEHRTLVLNLRPGTDNTKREAILAAWYRELIKTVVPALIAKWEAILGVKVNKCFVQHMKTKWGSCNPNRGNIRLNTELAKKPRECLEYIVVHEMMHLLEGSHNQRFLTLMDRFMPHWRLERDMLNRLPVRHEHWQY
jgi:predicted metal-dependent hydrolase